MSGQIRPVLTGQKELVVGISNDQSGLACAYLPTSFAHRITGGTVYVDGGTNVAA
jgi:enoyl-[acyl-carrier-protein] reductase (NADH)